MTTKTVTARTWIDQQVDPDRDHYDLASALLAFQAAIYVVTAIEAAAISAVSRNAAGWGPVLLSTLLAFFLLTVRSRIRRGRFIRVVRISEWSLLLWAGIDLALGLVMNGAWPVLVSVSSRIVVPGAVLALLARSRMP
ncbi:MAG: hypothetical protein ACRDWH_01005 [Acidimicrobiia bacterium]